MAPDCRYRVVGAYLTVSGGYRYHCAMKVVYSLLFSIGFAALSHAQLISNDDVLKWINVQLDCQADLPDPDAFSQRMLNEYNVTPEMAERLNVKDPSKLSAEDQKTYKLIKQVYQQELDEKIAYYAKRYGMNIHQYYRIHDFYDRDSNFRQTVKVLTYEIKQQRGDL